MTTHPPSAALRVLTYHHFAVRDGAATAHLGITTHPGSFARQLDALIHAYTIVSLDQVLAGDLPPRPLLITIDDAYRSVAEIAAPMLAERRLPAVLFANPRPITEPFVPLENVVSLLGGATAEQQVQAAIADVVGDRPAPLTPNLLPLDLREAVKRRLISRLAGTEAELHGMLDLFLTPGDLARLPDLGIEVANHTASHVAARTLDALTLGPEIAGARQTLEDITGRQVRAFAFPWGQSADATATALAAIRASGHVATFLMEGRRNERRPAADIWFRSHVDNHAPAALRFELEAASRLRSWRSGLRSPGLNSP